MRVLGVPISAPKDVHEPRPTAHFDDVDGPVRFAPKIQGDRYELLVDLIEEGGDALALQRRLAAYAEVIARKAGPPALAAGGSIDLLSGYSRDYTLSSPVEGGQTLLLNFAGVSGDLAFSLVSLAQAPTFQPALGGTLVLPVPPILISHGPVDPLTGVLPPVALTAPVLPAGVGALTVYAQGAAVTAVGAAVVCAPSMLTIL